MVICLGSNTTTGWVNDSSAVSCLDLLLLLFFRKQLNPITYFFVVLDNSQSVGVLLFQCEVILFLEQFERRPCFDLLTPFFNRHFRYAYWRWNFFCNFNFIFQNAMMGFLLNVGHAQWFSQGCAKHLKVDPLFLLWFSIRHFIIFFNLWTIIFLLFFIRVWFIKIYFARRYDLRSISSAVLP